MILVTITLGTGIGAGIIINNKIYKGFNNTAGEIGHMVIDKNGILCTCAEEVAGKLLHLQTEIEHHY